MHSSLTGVGILAFVVNSFAIFDILEIWVKSKSAKIKPVYKEESEVTLF